jgi:hypothetical protein
MYPADEGDLTQQPVSRAPRTEKTMKIRIAAIGVVLACIWILKASPVYAQDEGNRERALKQLQEKKNTKKLPYVCPKELGAQLQTVLASIKDTTKNGYKVR